MSHTKADYTDGDEKAPGMFFLRDELGCENLGFTVIEADAGWEGMEHDHESDGQEEVYYLVDGDASLEVDGESVGLSPGDAIRVAPEAARTLTAHEDSRLVVAGAP